MHQSKLRVPNLFAVGSSNHGGHRSWWSQTQRWAFYVFFEKNKTKQCAAGKTCISDTYNGWLHIHTVLNVLALGILHLCCSQGKKIKITMNKLKWQYVKGFTHSQPINTNLFHFQEAKSLANCFKQLFCCHEARGVHRVKWLRKCSNIILRARFVFLLKLTSVLTLFLYFFLTSFYNLQLIMHYFNFSQPLLPVG